MIDDVEINEIRRLHDYDLMDNYATAVLELKNMGPKTATFELLLDVSSPS